MVAELDHQVVGYIVGTVDARQFEHQLERYLRSRIGDIFLTHLMGTLKGSFRHTLSHRLIIRRYLALIRGERNSEEIVRHVELDLYPAHCHLQVAPEARAKRVGLFLMLKFQEILKAKGVRGQYSTVTEEVSHENYSKMLLAMGFRAIYGSTFTTRERPSLIHQGIWRDQVLVRAF